MNPRLKIASAALALLLLAGCASAHAASSAATQQAEQTAAAQTPAPSTAQAEQGLSPLSGLPTAAAGSRPVGVMLYNTPAALPQWGIADAQILLEANTEGQGSWLMALYDGADALPKVGPVGQGP